jgi:flagellar hook-basal body complex protein FliE
MKILAIDKAKCALDAIAFDTEPMLSGEILLQLEKLRTKNALMQRYRFENSDGILVIRSAGEPIAFSAEFQQVLAQALDSAEQAVGPAHQDKEQQQADKEQAIQDASHLFGVPIKEP